MARSDFFSLPTLPTKEILLQRVRAGKYCYLMFLVLLNPIFPFTPPHTNSSKGTQQAGGRVVRYEGGSGGPPETSYYEEFALGIGAIGFPTKEVIFR